MKRGLFAALDDDAYVGEQHHVHHQRIDDGRDGDDAIVEDERAGSDGDGLCRILHAHLDDDGTLLARIEPAQMPGQPRHADGQQYQGREAEAKNTEIISDSVVMLHEEDTSQKHQGREGDLREHAFHACRSNRPEMIHTDTQQNWNKHSDKVLHQQISDRQMDAHRLAHLRRGPVEDEGHREKRDDGTERRERHRQRHIALGQHREDVARRAARAAGYQHHADVEQGRQMEHLGQGKRDQRKDQQLAAQAKQNSPWLLEHQQEVIGTQREPQVEHQQRQDRKYDKDTVHR